MLQTLTVKGLRCEHCEAKVEKALIKLDGVNSAKANRENNAVVVDFNPDVVPADELRETIEDCGYEASL